MTDPQIERHLLIVKRIQKENAIKCLLTDSMAIFKYLLGKDSFKEKYLFTSSEMRTILDKVDKLQHEKTTDI